MSKSPRIVLVLGSHRCGTSLLTKALASLGVDLGDHLFAALPGENDKGFFEDRDVLSLSSDLMRAVGTTWDDLGFELEASQLEPLNERVGAAAALLERRFGTAAVCGFKNPRTARLLPFWERVVSHLGWADSYLVAVRHPLAAARSLGTRNGHSLEHATLLWFEHTLASLLWVAERPHVVCAYELMLRDSAAQLGRIAERLALPLAADDAAGREFAAGFVDASLNRHSPAGEDGFELPPIVRDCYELASEVACDRAALEDEAVRQRLSALEHEWASHRVLWRRLAHLEKLAAERDEREGVAVEPPPRSRAPLERRSLAAVVRKVRGAWGRWRHRRTNQS